MRKDPNDGKKPIRRMTHLLGFLIAGAVVLILLWMRNPPPGVDATTDATGRSALALASPEPRHSSGLRNLRLTS
ncbi:hypothetical protein QTI33_08370 [Variovorax sp. J22P271]|uniref:hypothetical protein n=1 Tax=Variovorax davisae TaxID=3053515 RepID=UPI002578D2B2|nr:hypothetical protein [Variovorax sp. J22P271]MDM0032149.1 hypothetical protein [Variovorax sp. J22P271]